MKIRWVDYCDTCAREGLALAAQSHKLRISLAGGAPQPPLEALLPEACAPVKLLQARALAAAALASALASALAAAALASALAAPPRTKISPSGTPSGTQLQG